jgi:hypothetical protein
MTTSTARRGSPRAIAAVSSGRTSWRWTSASPSTATTCSAFTDEPRCHCYEEVEPRHAIYEHGSTVFREAATADPQPAWERRSLSYVKREAIMLLVTWMSTGSIVLRDDGTGVSLRGSHENVHLNITGITGRIKAGEVVLAARLSMSTSPRGGK